MRNAVLSSGSKASEEALRSVCLKQWYLVYKSLGVGAFSGMAKKVEIGCFLLGVVILGRTEHFSVKYLRNGNCFILKFHEFCYLLLKLFKYCITPV